MIFLKLRKIRKNKFFLLFKINLDYMAVPPQIHGNLFPSGNIQQPIFSSQKHKYDETNTSAIISAAPQVFILLKLNF